MFDYSSSSAFQQMCLGQVVPCFIPQSWLQALNCLAVLTVALLYILPKFLSVGRMFVLMQAELWSEPCCLFVFFFLLS